MIGIIGGTGFYKVEGVSGFEPHYIDTPFGKPSGPVMLGKLNAHDVAFLARHGEKHQFLPSEVNFRANIWALKKAGVRQIVGVSAVGSLSEGIPPGDLAVVSQYLDFTKGKRISSFFGNGIVAHVSMAEPSCPCLAKRIVEVSKALSIPVHTGKTYACVEGPRFGTKAESFFFRKAGCDLVGMTNVPEAFLAREAQLCYCCIAVATDYDCWMEDPSSHATVEKIMPMYKQNLIKVQEIVKGVAGKPACDECVCSCRKSLEGAVMTPDENLTAENKPLLDFLRS